MVINNLSAANSQTDFSLLSKTPAKSAANSPDLSTTLASQLIAAENQDPSATSSTSNSAAEILAITSQNLAAANPIDDSDTADQVTSFLSNSMLNQSNLAQLAQANPLPESITSLLSQ